MLLKKRMKSGEVISTNSRAGSPVNINICNAHSIFISGDNGTVTYKKGGVDWADQTPIALAAPAEATNGFEDGVIWNQTDVSEIIVTATADCDVIINSYVDGK
jgi:hypothetical protein